MGKQPRRRHRNKNKNNLNKQTSDIGTKATENNNNNNNSSSSQDQPNGLITARIRHGDPRVRAGALSGLACTLFSPESLGAWNSSSKKNQMTKDFWNTKKNQKNKSNDDELSIELLKAISEKILDDDENVAKNAAGCWNNFILFGICGRNEQNATGTTNTKINSNVIKDIDIGAILISRIHSCHGQIISTFDKMDSISTENDDAKADTTATSSSISTSTSNKEYNTDDSIKKSSNKTKLSKNQKKKKIINCKKLISIAISQLDIANVCLQTLCGLIENIPEAVERFTSKLVVTNMLNGTNTSIPITHIFIQMLLLGIRASTTPSLSSIFSSTLTSTLELVGECMTWASRSLHSILDENLPLAQWFLSTTTRVMNAGSTSEQQSNCNSFNTLSTIIQGGAFSSKSRLHCCGTIITLRNLISSSSSSTTIATTSPSNSSSSSIIPAPPPFLNELNQSCVNDVLPILLQYLEYRPDIATAMIQRISDALYELEQEKQDERMEKKIIQHVNEKKEPTRAIAKRHKEAKRIKKAAAAASDGNVGVDETKVIQMKDVNELNDSHRDSGKNNDTSMDIAENIEDAFASLNENSASKNKKEKKSILKRNAQEDYENAVKAWKNASAPVKLALEVATNLCSGSYTDSPLQSVDGDDDVMMYDSDTNDDQVTIAENEGGAGDISAPLISTFDAPIMEAIVQSSLPECILSLLIAVSTPLNIKHLSRTVDKSSSNENNIVPKVAHKDISQIKSKCGACLGNIASTLPSPWGNDKSNIVLVNDEANGKALIVTIWESLCNAICLSSNSSESNDDLEGMAGLTNAMSSLLRFRVEDLIKHELNVSSEVKFFLQLLQSPLLQQGTQKQSTTNKDALAITEEITRNIISLIGICCTQMYMNVNDLNHDFILEATKEATTKFASMLSQPSSAISIQNEILNVLMDIYGNDDFIALNDLFESLQIMQVFKKTIPSFKRKINNAKSTSEWSEEEIFQWKETALNGNRFIKYKHDQMIE